MRAIVHRADLADRGARRDLPRGRFAPDRAHRARRLRCRLRARAGAPRAREGGARAASGWRLALWCAGVLVLFVALISPVDRLGEQLASMHMVQHLLIADIAPILLTLGLTKWILRPATRRIHRIERAAGPFGAPGLRRRRLRRRDVALARPGALRRGARAPGTSTCSST